MVGSRPDLWYIVTRLSQLLSCPTRAHWEAGRRVLRYIRGTLELRSVWAFLWQSDAIIIVIIDRFRDLGKSNLVKLVNCKFAQAFHKAISLRFKTNSAIIKTIGFIMCWQAGDAVFVVIKVIM